MGIPLGGSPDHFALARMICNGKKVHFNCLNETSNNGVHALRYLEGPPTHPLQSVVQRMATLQTAREVELRLEFAFKFQDEEVLSPSRQTSTTTTSRWLRTKWQCNTQTTSITLPNRNSCCHCVRPCLRKTRKHIRPTRTSTNQQALKRRPFGGRPFVRAEKHVHNRLNHEFADDCVGGVVKELDELHVVPVEVTLIHARE